MKLLHRRKTSGNFYFKIMINSFRWSFYSRLFFMKLAPGLVQTCWVIASLASRSSRHSRSSVELGPGGERERPCGRNTSAISFIFNRLTWLLLQNKKIIANDNFKFWVIKNSLGGSWFSIWTSRFLRLWLLSKLNGLIFKKSTIILCLQCFRCLSLNWLPDILPNRQYAKMTLYQDGIVPKLHSVQMSLCRNWSW